MKNLKPITLLLFLFIGLQSFAQSFTDGIFTTTFGNISWTTETGSEYPNGGIVYGDYKDKGTFIGNFDNNAKEVKGTFFNGSAEGKFVFIAPSGKTFNSQNIKTFGGFWGYNSDNIYSQNAADEWSVTGKTGEKNSIKNVTNVWSGKWNTTDGNMILQQVGNKIEGTYKGVGTVTATYNPSNRLLKGTFLNKQTNKSGFLEFYFEGNSFKGKWGWTAAMTGGNWNGDKHVKNNKELSKKGSQNASDGNSMNVLKNQMVDDNPKVTLQVSNNDSNSMSENVTQPAREASESGQRCSTSVTDYTAKTADFGYFVKSGTPEFIKPGVVLLYEDILSGNNKVNTTERNPLTIYLDFTGANTSNAPLSVSINSPERVSNINSALGTLNSRVNTTNTPANMSIEVSEISSEEQLQYGVSGSYSNKAIGISANFNINSTDYSSNYIYMVKFTQNMYTIRADNSTFSFKNNNLPNSDKLIYVSEVTYGRKGFLLIKTKKSKSQIEASLGVEIKTVGQSGEINAFINKVKEDKSSQVSMFFYGGNAATAAKSLKDQNFTTGFNAWAYSNAGNGRTALPISYKLKNMNGEQLLLTSIFTVRQQTCVPIKQYKLQIELESIRNTKSNDSDNKDDYVMEFEPILKIDGKTYSLTNKKILTTQTISFVGNNKLYHYDRNTPRNQLHVQESATQMIKNSGEFVLPEDANLSNAEFAIQFRIFESTNNSLDRMVGISKIGTYNRHDHNLLEIIQILTKTKKLSVDDGYTQCAANCRGTAFGHYGNATKWFLSGGTVPVESGEGNDLLRAGEHMLNETKTRSLSLNYTFKLIN